MAQNYEIDIKRFNGQDYDTLLPTPASHASTHQVGGSDPITVATNMLDSGAVTRDKLAQDALHSPIIRLTSSKLTHDLALADDGKTIMTMTGSKDYTVTLSADAGTDLPEGFEIGICLYYGNSLQISIASGVSIAYKDHGKVATGQVFEISEQNTMVALKKMLHYNGVGYWLLTGEAEVVS